MGPTIREVAGHMAVCLRGADREAARAEALRLAFSFVEIFDKAALDDRPSLVEQPPAGVGDPRYDALLAAVVEHLCARSAASAPAWVEEAERFLDTWWFVSGLRSLHADALVHSPISFARRGVFVTGDSLSYA